LVAKSKNNTEYKIFENSDSAFVFLQVGKRLQSGETRSLWRRIESERRHGGIGAVESYLRSSFEELVQRIRENSQRFKETFRE